MFLKVTNKAHRQAICNPFVAKRKSPHSWRLYKNLKEEP